MTTATRSVAVVATRLPDIDRRALSQAWFSALHLAEPAVTHVASPRTALAAGPFPKSSNRTTVTAEPAAVGSRAGTRDGTSRAASVLLPRIERRALSSELARRIERAVVKHLARGPQRSAAIVIDAGEGRVHLLVRIDPTATRIVALCSPQLRDRVDRALAHARFALAASGTRLEVAG